MSGYPCGWSRRVIFFSHFQKVYAAPTYRDMDCKGTSAPVTYPNIYFTVDQFEEVGTIIFYTGLQLLGSNVHALQEWFCVCVCV